MIVDRKPCNVKSRCDDNRRYPTYHDRFWYIRPPVYWGSVYYYPFARVVFFPVFSFFALLFFLLLFSPYALLVVLLIPLFVVTIIIIANWANKKEEEKEKK